jgi:hypothetical protein
MNTKKICFLSRKKITKLSRKRQTDTQNLYHLLHQSWSYNGKRDEMDRFKINNRSMKSLEQSWMRTKSKSFEDYKKAMDLKAIKQYCMDKEGNIAYWHGNFIQ